jgi:O-antigen/teichoic acid export membrane protein
MSKQSLFKNVASLGIMQIANYALPLITVPIISRIIGPDKFGVINYAASFMVYFNLLIAYGFDLTATRRIAKDPQNQELKNEVFSQVQSAKYILFFVSALLFAVCLFTVPLLATEKTVALCSFMICMGTVFTQNWLFQAMQDLPRVAILNFFGKLIFTMLVIYLVKEKSDYIWQPLITGLVHILISLLTFFWAIKKYNLNFHFIGWSNVIDVLLKERTVFFSIIVINLYTTTNIVVLGLLQDESAVGFYTAGQKLVEVIGMVLLLPLSQSLFPVVGFAFSQSRAHGIDVVQRIVPVIVILTLGLIVAMYCIGPLFLLWFYGEKFLPAVTVFKVAAPIPMLLALSNLFGIQVMLNLGMDKAFFKITAYGALFGFLLNVLMVNVFGYVGTAWNLLIVELYITLAMYVYLKRKGVDPINLSKFSFSEIKTQLKPLINKFLK